MRTKKKSRSFRPSHVKGLNQLPNSAPHRNTAPTVRDWLTRGKLRGRSYHRVGSCSVCGHERHDFATLPIPEYTYLLGIYLGDGCISTIARRGFTCCGSSKTCGIRIYRRLGRERSDGHAKELGNVQYYVGGGNCSSIISSSKAWPCLLPQHGAGRKHLRPIHLTDWQQELVDRDPRRL